MPAQSEDDQRNAQIEAGVVGGVIGVVVGILLACWLDLCPCNCAPSTALYLTGPSIATGTGPSSPYSMVLTANVVNPAAADQTAQLVITSTDGNGTPIGSYTVTQSIPPSIESTGYVNPTVMIEPFENPAGGFVTGQVYLLSTELMVGGVKQGSTYTWTVTGPYSYGDPVLS